MVKIANVCLAALAGIFFSPDLWVAADVVVYLPVPTSSADNAIVVSASFAGVSAIDVQSNGATLYVATVVESFAGVTSDGHTSTLFSTPTTTLFTFAEDASRFSASNPAATGASFSAGVELTCTATGSGGGLSCVQAEAISAAGGLLTTATTTYAATAGPIFTITASSGAARIAFPLVSLTIPMGLLYLVL